MFITVNKVGEKSITGKVGSESYNLVFTPELFKQLSDLASKAEDADDLETLKEIQAEFRAVIQTVKSQNHMEEIHPDLFYDAVTGHYHLRANNRISKIPLPQPLVDRIILSHELGISPTPVVKAWIRFLRNPVLKGLGKDEFAQKVKRFANYLTSKFVDVEEASRLVEEEGLDYSIARERATVNEVSITKEGLLCTYKWSEEVDKKYDPITGEEVDRYPSTYDEDTGERIEGEKPEFIEDRVFTPAIWKDGDKFLCNGKLGYIMKVGATIELPTWDQVNCDDHRSGVKGLHVGNLTYIQNFGNADRVCHEVFVDPMDIGAITNDGTGALRVRRYFIYASFSRPQKQLYKSSTYAAEGDATWEKMKAEAVETKAAQDAENNTMFEEYINL